jgi:elongation factor 3
MLAWLHDKCASIALVGGVVVISHHQEFTGAICNETWHVANGKLTITKENKDEDEEI